MVRRFRHIGAVECHIDTPSACQINDFSGSIFLCGLAPDSDRFRVLKLTGDGKVTAEFGETGEEPGLPVDFED